MRKPLVTRLFQPRDPLTSRLDALWLINHRHPRLLGRCSVALALKLLVFLLNGVAVFPRLSIGSVPCVAIVLGYVF
jgi:hypothetical protein